MPSALGSSFTTTVGVIDRVHGSTTDVWSPTEPPLSASLAQDNPFMVGVADHTNRRSATSRDTTNLAAGQCQLGPISVAGHQRGSASRGATHDAAFPRY